MNTVKFYKIDQDGEILVTKIKCQRGKIPTNSKAHRAPTIAEATTAMAKHGFTRKRPKILHHATLRQE